MNAVNSYCISDFWRTVFWARFRLIVFVWVHFFNSEFWLPVIICNSFCPSFSLSLSSYIYLFLLLFLFISICTTNSIVFATRYPSILNWSWKPYDRIKYKWSNANKPLNNLNLIYRILCLFWNWLIRYPIHSLEPMNSLESVHLSVF